MTHPHAEAAHGLTLLARLGFAARGLVYILIGWFAVDAARSGARPGDNQAALASLADGGLGRGLLFVIALGLAGYAAWRLVQAALDPELRRETMKGRFERAGYAVSGISHVLLAIYALRLALRSGGGGGGSAPGDAQAHDWTAWLMGQPGGTLLVILVGLGFLAVAVAQAVKAWKAEFVRELEGDVPAPRQVRIIGRLGYAARAIVFALVGWFFVRAALTADPQQAGGMGQALRELQQQGPGTLLLAVVAAGLFLFGIFSLVEARFRNIQVAHRGA
jgi:hypothetical protein